MRTALFTLIALACSSSVPAAVYKWVDANGVVHYSDQPQPGAAKVQVAPPQTYRSSDLATEGGNAAQAQQAPAPVQGSCTLVRPTQEEVFMNTSTVGAQLRMDLQMNPGDHIAFLLDGARQEVGDTSGAFTISQLERGTHTLVALVETSDGQLRCQTQTVTFYVHQPSLQSPTNPVRPH